MSLTITLLGAESTGKTTLAGALAAELGHHGLRVAQVPEVLREWCERTGRVPVAGEQQAIADEQARRTDAARASGADVVVADTAPLVVAVYSAWLFEDPTLLPAALDWQRGCDATLVAGMDLPWTADGLRDGPQAQAPFDGLLRQVLRDAGIGFQVVYGSGEARLRNALDAIAPLLPEVARPAPRGPQRPWQWRCDTCSDADCEHRLFTRLRAG